MTATDAILPSRLRQECERRFEVFAKMGGGGGGRCVREVEVFVIFFFGGGGVRLRGPGQGGCER